MLIEAAQISKKVCHLTTVHVRYDTRIYVKECSSLANNGYEVYLLVADGNGNEFKNGVHIYDIGLPNSRIKRMAFSGNKILKLALSLEADIYHFHDPELLRIGNKLIKKGKSVIYDSHEDVPRQVLDKAYLPSVFRKPLSKLVEWYENKIISKLSGIITVTPILEERFSKINKKVIQVRNFPKTQEFDTENVMPIRKEKAVCYVGSITKVRGILNIVHAMQYLDCKLLLGGKFESSELRNKTINLKGWKNVVELGFLSRVAVENTLKKSVAGLVVLEPTRSYVDSIPVKMFEYMIAGIPVIASDFPYWRELIGYENCAIFVDPKKPKEISKAIKTLLENQKLASEMGERGQKAIIEKFNWSMEESKLLRFYEQVME